MSKQLEGGFCFNLCVLNVTDMYGLERLLIGCAALIYERDNAWVWGRLSNIDRVYRVSCPCSVLILCMKCITTLQLTWNF